MCPEHRTEVLGDIRNRLLSGGPCRVVATQLVEAGVDLDFPVVFRALAGLDSLAQAAGRCNREGRFERGVLEIYVAETQPPPGELRQALDAARIVAGKRGGAPDLFGDPALYNEFFLQFYGRPVDAKGIQTDRASLSFEKVAQNFRMIDDDQESLVIPYDPKCRAVLTRLKTRDGVPRLLRRRLQRYTVAVRKGQMTALRDAGAAVETESGSGIFVLADPYAPLYDRRFGLLPLDRFAADPENLIA
jgi:CRISPR-associated endonuclease/helicase Cas3